MLPAECILHRTGDVSFLQSHIDRAGSVDINVERRRVERLLDTGIRDARYIDDLF